MKKSVFVLLAVALAFISFNRVSFAQSSFKGTITYGITYEGTIEPAVLAQLPKEMEFKIYENKSRMDANQGGVFISTIKDGDKKTMTILMDIQMLSKKIMMKTTPEQIKESVDKLPPSTVKFYDETKEIAGYKCKKGELITKNDEGKENAAVFYYTDELGVGDKNFDGAFKDVKGTLMEYTENAGEITKKFVVTKVKKGKVSEKDFLIPTGYEEMTQEQLMEMFGGGK
jgi:hypothetical protein